MLSNGMFSMLLYITSIDPEECVSALSDQLLREQLTVATDILQNALLLLGCSGPITTPDVPLVSLPIRWAAGDWAQFMWVAAYAMCIVETLEKQGVVTTEAAAVICSGQVGYLLAGETRFPAKWPLPEAGYETSLPGLLSQYRDLLVDEYDKRSVCGRDVTWTNRDPPEWVEAQ